jgi:hypothetical protein
MGAITLKNTDETPLDLDPELVRATITDVKSGSVEQDDQGPSSLEIKKTERAEKYKRMRDALYRARGFTPPEDKEIETDVDSDEEDEEEYNGKIDTSDEPRDPVEY